MFTKKSVFRFVLVLSFLVLSGCQANAPAEDQNSQPEPVEVENAADQDETTEAEQPVDAPAADETAADPDLVADYESGELGSGRAADSAVGFLTWSDGSPVSIELVDLSGEIHPPDELPNSTRALAVSVDIGQGGWAGMTRNFSNAAMDQWVTQDWSPYAGISFWVYGRGTEGQLLFEILENRNPDSTVDDAERWNLTILDDFTGWRFFEVPFEEFNRKDIGNGAPNDGLELEEVHGYAFGGFGLVGMGAQTYLLDEVRLYGVAPERPVLISFMETSFSAREGGKGKIHIELNKPAQQEVTVDFSLGGGGAVPGQDFSIELQTVTFPAGETRQSIEILPLDDSAPEGQESIILVLSNPVGAQLSPMRRAVFTIRDNDPGANLIHSFEALTGLRSSDELSLAFVEVAEDDAMAQDGQLGWNTVLSASPAGPDASFWQTFAQAEDWSGYDGLQFWLYGRSSGERMDVNVFFDKVTDAGQPLELVWSDEFNGPSGQSPDFFVWRPELGDGFLNGLQGWGNAQLEHNSGAPENVHLDGNGNLVITAVQQDPDTTDLVCWYGSCEYTSSRLVTADSVEFQYGRVEARIKFPAGQGLWPAFWMLGADIAEVGWPQSGEIDIMEYLGHDPNTIYGSLHGPGYSGGSNIGEEIELPEGDFSDDFHVFAVEWTPEGIQWELDGVVYHSVSPEDLPAGGEWVYDKPFFIIINLAVGGHWPGNPDEATVFPAEILFDYVRVYQVPADYAAATFSVADDFEGWQLIEIPFADMQSAAELDTTAVWGYEFVLGNGEITIDNIGFIEKAE